MNVKHYETSSRAVAALNSSVNLINNPFNQVLLDGLVQ